MKKLLIVSAILLSSNLIYAQNQTLSVSYGVYSTDQFIFAFSSIFSSIASEMAGNGTYETSGVFGPLAVSYHRILKSNERFSFGGSLVFDHAKFVDKDTKNNSHSFNAFTLAPEGKFKYLQPQSKFNVYGLLGAGLTVISYENFTDSKTGAIPHFNFQVTPIGLEYGSDVKGFLELGIGYKGFVSGGIAYNF